MLTLHKLVAKGVQEAISRLEGGRKQSMDAYTIGSTVQPVVDVNKGVLKQFYNDSVAGNVEVNYTVPVGKKWKIVAGYIYLDTDANVGNRYMYVRENFGWATAIQVVLATSAAVAANGVGSMHLHGVTVQTNVDNVQINNHEFYGGDILNLLIVDGVVGDAWKYYIEVLEFDV